MSASSPHVSVVIPAFNAATTVTASIRSALAQAPIPLEVLVVDDGSTDGTASAIATLAGDPRVRVLHHPDRANHGVAASRNLAGRNARGSYVAFLDADDEWLPDTLEPRLRTLAADTTLTLVYGRVQVESGTANPAPSWGDGPPRPGSLLPWLLFENPIPLSTVIARRNALGERPFPEGLGVQIEDWLAWLQIAPHGRFAFLPRVVATYRIGPGSWTSRQADATRRHGQLVAEAAELRRRAASLPVPRARVREAVAYRAGVLLVEALGLAARARPHRARAALAAAWLAAASPAAFLLATAWIPRLKWHAWTRPPRPSPVALRFGAVKLS